MKKLIFIGVMGLFVLGSCNSKNTGHEGHDHETVTHNHDEHEGHDHEAEGHDHEAEGADHSHEGECSGGHDHGKAATSEPADEHSDEIILPKAKANAAGVKVNAITPAPFQQVIKTSGQVLAAQGDESVAVATVAGVVSFRGKVTEGMSVGRGTPLVTISSHNIADGDPVQRARIASKYPKGIRTNEVARQKQDCVRQGFRTGGAELRKRPYQLRSARQNHSAIGQNITAPIAGYVKSILVNEGDYVTIGQPLVSVTQNRRLFLRAEVSEKYYPYLRTISSANFRTPYNNEVYELNELSGRLLSFGKTSGDNSFYVPVTFEFDNKGEVIPGSFVEVYLLSSQLENVISVPRTALTEEQGIFFVYLQLDEEGYKKQEVTLGADNGKSVQILTGIKPGDRVVTEGAYQVRLASASNAIPAHSHEH